MDQEKKISTEIWLMLAQLREDQILTPDREYIVYEVITHDRDPRYPSVHNQLKIMSKLESWGAIKEIRRNYLNRRGSTADMSAFGDVYDMDPRGIVLEILLPKFDELYQEYSKYDSEPLSSPIVTAMFSVNIKDREVRVNDFVLSRPHAAGRNMRFMEYIFNHPDKDIDREDLPVLLRKEIKTTKFTILLHELGFTGEILKAFFPMRSQERLRFRKTISRDELEQQGISADVLLQAIKLAHTKSNRK
jgi:hypothetical protein